MSRWIILYDDGKTPKTHHMVVEAETAALALEAARARAPTPKQIWAVALESVAHDAAATLFHLARMTEDCRG